MAHVPAAFYLKARPVGKKKKFRRVGRHRRTGRLIWLGTAYALSLRRRKLLQTTFLAGEFPSLQRRASKQGLGLKTVEQDVTPLVQGKEENVHPDLLAALQTFMERHGGSRSLSILSGFRSYASQLALWLLYLAGRGNLAARPGSSKHEATGGFKTARAVDAYVDGVAFWTWVDNRKSRSKAEALGLRQPYPSEHWHTEKFGL